MLTFKNRPGKREVQNKVFSQIKNKTVYGLGGPNIVEYIILLIKNDFTKLFIYEQDINLINSQISELKQVSFENKKIDIIYGSIHKNLNNINCFYDLDYCGNITTIAPNLKKIDKIKKFSLTLTMRDNLGDGFYIENILNKEIFDGKLNVPTKYVTIKKKKVLKKTFNNYSIKHNGFNYKFYTYRDTCPMLMIFKTK